MSELELDCCPLCGRGTKTKDIDLVKIKESICEKHGIAIFEIESRSRKQHIVKARNEAMILCKQQTNATLEEIGKCFNRDHSTVIHAISSKR